MTPSRVHRARIASHIYVGCRTTAERHARGKGIEVFEVGADGGWMHTQSVDAGVNPSYLVVSPARSHLHCVHGDGATVSSFRIQAHGGLHALGQRPTGGTNPVHLTFSPDGRWMIVANYASGSLAVLPVLPDGSLGDVVHLAQLPDQPGPHRTQQRGAHPHQVQFDRSGQWLVVPDKGGDAVHTLRLNADTGHLELVDSLKTAPGSGPRHLVFRADGKKGWLVLELASQVLTFDFDVTNGRLTALQRTTTVPDTFTGENTGAGIAYSDALGTLWVSNRGHGSIVAFAADPTTGHLRPVAWTDVRGRIPRFICLAPDGCLWIANEDADNIVSLDPSPPSSVSTLALTGSPVCVAFTQGRP